jgi:hypothetical protein
VLGLAGGGDRGQLGAALAELAAPGAVEAHVAVAVQLVEEDDAAGDDAVAGAVVGGVTWMRPPERSASMRR